MSVVFSFELQVVTINKNPAYPLEPIPKRLNHFSVITSDANFKVFDAGPTQITGIILLKNVLKSEGDLLRTWLLDDAIFDGNPIRINPPANTDLGEGEGVEITNARYWGGKTLEGVFELIPPGKYNITFPYWVKKL